MGEFADDALDSSIAEWLMEGDEPYEDYGVHPDYVKLPKPKVGDKCDRIGCKGHFVERTNSKTNAKFIGCSEFPKCKRSYSINLRKPK